MIFVGTSEDVSFINPVLAGLIAALLQIPPKSPCILGRNLLLDLGPRFGIHVHCSTHTHTHWYPYSRSVESCKDELYPQKSGWDGTLDADPL